MSKTIKKDNDNQNEKINRLAERTDKVLEKVTRLDESVEEYTEKELEYLDRYKDMTGDLMDDEELYEIITKFNFDDYRIKKEVNELLKIIKKRGEEYSWTKIENGKSKF
jgi:hypothetical protein